MSQEALLILGHININDVIELLKQAYPTLKVQDGNSANDNFSATDVVVKRVDFSRNSVEVMAAELASKKKEVDMLKQANEKSVVSIQSLNKQQKALYDEFVLLRQKYDQQKVALVNVLWTHCCAYHPELRQIPQQIPDAENFVETEDQVGGYVVRETLGEGQFAMVKCCVKEGINDQEYALKIIQKERITSFTSLARVSTEIDNLKHLKNSKHIIKITDIIQTQSKLYIVTEKGGLDLFEFFDAHPDGVPEPWAKQIVGCILKATMYCHDQGICHRDLKPENILVTFDPVSEKCIDLKLCDFGLSTKFNPRVMLTDFCGSPGFFAPEMIIHGTYFGDKVDVWSIGCILLELILGHEKFCDVWMASYDYEVLQEKSSFTLSIEDTLRKLPRALNFSPELNDFALRLLQLKSSKRPTIRSIGTHLWLEGLLDQELAALRAAKLAITETVSPQRASSPTDSADMRTIQRSLSHSHSPNPFANLGTTSGGNGQDGEGGDFRVDTEVLKRAFQNLSEKERKQMEEYILRHRQDAPDYSGKHLPPIEPPTPSIGQARKLLNRDQSKPFFSASGDGNSTPQTPLKTSGNFLLSPIPRGLISSTSRSHLPGLIEHQGSQNSIHEGSSHSQAHYNAGVEDAAEIPTSTRSLHSDDDKMVAVSPLVSSQSSSSIKIT